MFDILKDKQLFEGWILAVLPLLAVSSTLKAGLILSVTVVLALIVSVGGVFALKSFLTEKTAPFAQLVLAVGTVGISAALLRLGFNEDVTGLGIYISVAAISAVLMLKSDYIIKTDIFGIVFGVMFSVMVGVGFLLASSLIREFLGYGSILGFDIYSEYFTPVSFFATPAGGLLMTAIFIIGYRVFAIKPKGRRNR